MPEPVLGDLQLVLDWDRDAGLFTLRSFRAEAAGISIIPFERASISFDSARFAQVNVVEFEEVESVDDLRQHDELLSLLVTASTRRRIGESLEVSADRRVRLDADAPTNDAISRQRRLWAQLALALESADSPGLVPIERDLQLLEAAAIARELGLLTLIPGLGSTVERASMAIGQLSIEEFRELDTQRGRGLRNLLREAASLLDDLARRRVITLIELSDRAMVGERYLASISQATLGRPTDRRSLSSQREASAREFVAALDNRIEDAHSVSIAALGPGMTLRQSSADESVAWLLGFAERAQNWWIRAFVPNGPYPVAMAPFLPTPAGDAEAAVLLPPWLGTTVEWDIVDDPGRRRPSMAISRFMAAIALGKAAARHERLGDGEAAIDLWYACSELHGRAGDSDRSSQARGRLAESASIGRAAARRGTDRVAGSQPPVLADAWLPRHRSRTPSRKGPGLQ